MIGFKLKYTWYEGEEGQVIVTHKSKKESELVKDLIEIEKDVSNHNYGESVKCLPSAYERTIDLLIKKGYCVIPNYCIDELYIDDLMSGDKFKFTKRIKKIEWENDIDKFFI